MNYKKTNTTNNNTKQTIRLYQTVVLGPSVGNYIAWYLRMMQNLPCGQAGLF